MSDEILNLSLSGDDDDLRRRVEMLERPRGLMAAVGKRAEIELRNHFDKRNDEANKQGWPKRGFWGDVRQATALTYISDTEATITIAHPALNQKIHGGTITPKRGRFLAIPATQEAYAAGSPREGGMNLRPETIFMGGGRTAVALVEAWSQSISYRKNSRGTKVKAGAESQGGRVQYWLVKSVETQADEKALPTSDALQAAVEDEARKYLDRQGTR
jgi:hypothetical protein